MSLKFRYFLFVFLLHGALWAMAYRVFSEQFFVWILAQVVLLISIFTAYKLYRAFVEPLKLIRFGVNAIKDEDFNITFSSTTSAEMNTLIEVYNSMIEKIREERISIKEQHFFLEKLIEASPSGIVILNFDSKITDLNPAAQKLLHLDDTAVGSKAVKAHPLLQEATQLTEGKPEVFRMDGWRQYKCHKSHFIHQGFERYFILIEELSNEILATEKQAYGKVIRMMAHEVNNSIGAVNSILQSVREIHETEDEDPQVGEALKVAEERNDRLNIFMRNFAHVIRLPAPQKETLNLHSILVDIVHLFQVQADAKNIEFQYELKSPPLVIEADHAQLDQVLINIIKNAMESIESDGSIHIRTATQPSRLIIQDNGKGIHPSIEENLFKPFYSTKPQGQGIGLTLIKEILHQHHFQFSLKTLDVGNTQFEIIFSET